MDALLKEKKKNKIPSYGKRGSARSFGRYVLITLGTLIVLLGLLVLAIHVPAMLYKPEETVAVAKENSFLIKPDETGIRNMLEYVRDHQNEDFDNDGLTNGEELKYATDPRDPDTDLDGVCDYAEVYMFESRPGQKGNQLDTAVNDLLKKNNLSVNSPFKLHDIIMWADNLHSRSAGTVIPTIRGYRFKNFNGWAQFPGTVYAYKLDGQFHTPLSHKEKEDAWRIESENEDIEVVLYASPLETIHMLDFFGRKYYVETGIISDIFDIILPKEHSFICCKSVVKQDTFDLEIPATITEAIMPKFDKTDLGRFGKTTSEFENLTKVYTSIKSGKPVAVSLQSQQYGEVIGMIYGFTDFGDLLFADEFGNKTDKSGREYILEIKEQSAITIDHTGELRQREYFDYSGLGFDSEKGDKICFMFPQK